jgi:abequosyltransferase
LRLSICIPTHHGRAPLLQEAVASVLDQVEAGQRDRLELCISDNASHDGTEAWVAGLAHTAPIPVVYHRNERNLGVGANILRVVEIASGDFCWLFGSDDHMADGGIATVLDLIERFPDASGIAVPRVNFAPDMVERQELDPPEFFAPDQTPTLYEGYARVLDAVGFSHGYLSSNVIRRDRWLAAAADVSDAALAHRTWPQVFVMGEMAWRDPAWAWTPRALVKARSGSPYLMDDDELGRDLAAMHIELATGLDAVWRELARGSRPLHRRMMRKAYAVCGNGHVVSEVKRQQRSLPLRRQAALLSAFARCFWFVPRFWTDALPQLLVPAAVSRALERRRADPARGPAPLEAGDCRTRISFDVPTRLPSRAMPRLRCRVYNAGGATLASTGVNPVHLSYRWIDPGSGELVLNGFRTALRGSLGPGREQQLELRLLTPWDEGTYGLHVSLVQEHVRWFDELDPANGVAGEVRVEHPG